MGYICSDRFERIKNRVYRVQPNNLEDLCNHILEEAALIDRIMIRNAVSNFYEFYVAYCQIMSGV